MDHETIIREAVARVDTRALERDWAIMVESMPYYYDEQGFADGLRAVLLAALLPPPQTGGSA